MHASLVRVLCFWLIVLFFVGWVHRHVVEAVDGDCGSRVTPNFGGIPLRLGEWEGVDVPIDSRVLAAARTDAHLNRRYTHRDSTETVEVYVAFTHRPVNMLGHRPDVCYPANGWTLEATDRGVVSVSGEPSFDCLVHRFHRGDRDGERLVVLNYYLLPNGTTTDWNAFAGLQWRRRPSPDEPEIFVAQVQVVAAALLPQRVSSAVQAVERFAQVLAPEIRAALASATDHGSSREPSN